MDSTERRAEVTWNAALRAGAAARLHTQERAPVGMALAARVTAAAARVMAASRRRRRRELDRRATDRTRAGRPATAKMATAASRRAGVTLLLLLHEKRRRLRAGRADTTRGRSTPSSSRVPRLRRPFHRPTIRSAKSLCAAVLRRYKAHGHLVFHSCRPAATAPRRRPGTPATATATPVSSFAFAVRCGPRTFVASACSVLLLLRQCRFCLPCSRFTGLPRARPCPASLWPLTLSARGATQTASADRRRIAPTHGGSTLTAAHKQSPPAGVEVDAHTLPRAFSGETRTKSAPLRGRPSRGR